MHTVIKFILKSYLVAGTAVGRKKYSNKAVSIRVLYWIIWKHRMTYCRGQKHKTKWKVPCSFINAEPGLVASINNVSWSVTNACRRDSFAVKRRRLRFIENSENVQHLVKYIGEVILLNTHIKHFPANLIPYSSAPWISMGGKRTLFSNFQWLHWIFFGINHTLSLPQGLEIIFLI